MKHLILTLIILSSFACSQSSQESIFDLKKVSQGDVVIEINDAKIHQGFIDLLGELNPRLQTQLANPLTRKKILDSLVDQHLLYQEAVKRNIHKSEDVLIKSLLNKHVIVSNALVESELDSAMHAAYNQKKDEQFTKLRVSLISAEFNIDPADKNKTVTPESEKVALAKISDIKAKLDAGADFAKLASEMSDDNKTKKKGGDAGQISKNDRRFARLNLDDVTAAAFNLKKDQVSAPIKTKSGYYLVKVTSDPDVVPFEEAERALRFELQTKIKDDLVQKLKKDAKINFVASQKEAAVAKTSPEQKVGVEKLKEKLQNNADDHSGHEH